MSSFQKRLFQYQQQPSQKVWENIESVLESEAQFPNRLYEYEAQPRTEIWENIEAHLSAPVVPFTTSYRRPLRYAAAAAVLAALVFSASLFLNKKAAQQTVVADTSAPAQQQNISSAPEQNNITTQEQVATIQQGNDRNKFASSQNIIPTKENLALIHPKDILADNVTPECLIAEVKDKINHLDLNNADQFMVYCCDGTGNPVKLPKKLYDVVNCGEENPSCRQNIQCLQEKASSATLTTDFLGVLQIIKQVQENQ